MKRMSSAFKILNNILLHSFTSLHEAVAIKMAQNRTVMIISLEENQRKQSEELCDNARNISKIRLNKTITIAMGSHGEIYR